MLRQLLQRQRPLALSQDPRRREGHFRPLLAMSYMASFAVEAHCSTQCPRPSTASAWHASTLQASTVMSKDAALFDFAPSAELSLGVVRIADHRRRHG